jgi:hypothetical protein
LGCRDNQRNDIQHNDAHSMTIQNQELVLTPSIMNIKYN